jgi:nicotinamidase-related amidase
MKIPDTHRKRALCVVDVQSAFVSTENSFVIPQIKKLLATIPYDYYIESLFWSDAATLWAKQANEVLFPKDQDFRTIPEVAAILRGKEPLRVEKHTKSVFKGTPALEPLLREAGIEEVHFVGYETDDCVLVSAEESFDLGFYTYVIEECTASYSGPVFREHALAILRNMSMTNASCVENVGFLDVP